MSRQLFEKVFLIVLGTYLTYIFTLKLLDYTMLQESGQENIIVPNQLNLTSHEKIIYSMVVDKSNLKIGFDDVKGLPECKRLISKQIIKPLKSMKKCSHKLIQPPNGIIFYGPPGTGKTMLSKALCKSTNMNFINFSTNIIENKMFGESSKLVNALFTLAEKLKPCVVFIDEIDGFFGTRNDFEQGFVTNIKTLFYTKMDGMIQRDNSIVFIGATNRLNSVDPAMLRRMRLHVEIGLPDWEARKQILQDSFDGIVKFDLEELKSATIGMSGSDIHELCKIVANEKYDFNKNTFKNISKEDVESIVENYLT